MEFTILSPVSPERMREIESECYGVIREWYENHDDPGDEWGEFHVGGMVPAPREAARMVWLDDDRPAPESSDKTRQVLTLLGNVRSSLTIAEPGDIAVDLLQVSILRFLLERAGTGLICMSDSLEPAELILDELRDLPGAPGFDEIEGARITRNPERFEEESNPRAERIHELMWRAHDNPILGVDIRSVLKQAPELAQSYAMWLVQKGPTTDASAAAGLKVKVADLAAVAEALHHALEDAIHDD